MASHDRIVLVTGATGQQGGATARELLDGGYRVRAMTRNPDGEAARDLRRRGAEVVYCDFDEPDSLGPALEGAWATFSVQNTWEAGVEREEEQGKRFARAAREAGIEHFVYTSVGSAHRNTGIPHFENKWRIEETVRELGFPSCTILRPVFFMENFASPWYLPGLQEGKLVMGIDPETPLQMIAVADVGKYAFLAFDRAEEMNGVELDIAGDERTMPETARTLGEAMGREIEFVRQPIEEVRAWSEDFALMLEWFDREGYEADMLGNAERYGVRPTPLVEWARSVSWPPPAAG